VSQAFAPTTGRLRTDAGEEIGPGLTRADFLGSSLAGEAEHLIGSEPYSSWRIARHLDGLPFRLGLYFQGDRLEMVVLALDDPAFGSSWADWTRENETARKRAHDAWLGTVDPAIGEGRSVDWGSVQSVYDDHSAGSQIVLVYAARA
jgi:hypothetical protein